MAQETETEYIDAVLEEWAPIVIQHLHQGINQRNLLLSEDLYRSLRWEIIKASSGLVSQAKLSFRTHGRWRDMKTTRNFKQPPINEIIEEFIKKIGVSNFKYVPGYEKSRTIPTDSIAIRRIAWGISKGILKKHSTAARKWYSKNFFGSINLLIEKLLVGTQGKAADSVTKSLGDA